MKRSTSPASPATTESKDRPAGSTQSESKADPSPVSEAAAGAEAAGHPMSSLAGFGLSPLQTQVAIARYGGDEGGGGGDEEMPIGLLTAKWEGSLHLILELLLPATLGSLPGSLPQSTGVENLRGACRGGRTFIERNVKATFIDAMCSSAADADAAAAAVAAAAVAAAAEAEWECDHCGGINMPEDERCTEWECDDGKKPPEFTPHKLCDLYEKRLNSSPTMGENANVYPEVVTSLGYIRGAPVGGAEIMALYRGLQMKAVMIYVVNELQVVDVYVDEPLKKWEGVTVGADGQVVKIDFSYRCKGGA
jgi:hypothetical protein